jgi:hypothetical protein
MRDGPRPAAARPGFTVRVSTFTVDVVVTWEPLIFRGEPANGIADFDNRRIILAAGMQPHLRLLTLAHEVWHCWRFAFERPRKIEAECDFFGYAAGALVEDLGAQGGIEAFMALFDGEKGGAA